MDPDRIPAVGRIHHGGQQHPDLIDFSANVNPCVPSGVESVYGESLEAARRYPQEPPRAYQQSAAEYVDCASEQVIPTPGGLAAIRLAIACTVHPGDSVIVPAPGFGEYAREIRLQGGEPRFIPEYELLEADPTGSAVAIVCQPNNPTGLAYDCDALLAFINRCREVETTVIVDEAFLGFTDRPSLAGRSGVIVARSLTKLFGLPGLRAGFAVATGPQLDALHRARQPWNLSTPAMRVGSLCMQDDGFVRATRCRVRRERARLTRALSSDYTVFPSEAPFLLLDVGEQPVDRLVASAQNQGIAIRDATTFRGLSSHIRVSIRLPEENDRLLDVLTDV